MLDFKQFKLSNPIVASITVAIVLVIYLSLMAFSVYLPPILLISGLVGYITYLGGQSQGGQSPPLNPSLLLPCAP